MHGLVVTGTNGGEEAGPDQDLSTPTQIIFPREAVREAVLLLVREKTSRFSTVRVRNRFGIIREFCSTVYFTVYMRL